MPITFRPLHPLICPNLRMKRKYLLKIMWRVMYDFSSNRIKAKRGMGYTAQHSRNQTNKRIFATESTENTEKDPEPKKRNLGSRMTRIKAE